MSHEISYSKARGLLKLWERKKSGKRKLIQKFPIDSLIRILLAAIESFDGQIEEVCTSDQCEVTEKVVAETKEDIGEVEEATSAPIEDTVDEVSAEEGIERSVDAEPAQEEVKEEDGEDVVPI